MSQFSMPKAQWRWRYQYPVRNLYWPFPVSEISERDRQLLFETVHAKNLFDKETSVVRVLSLQLLFKPLSI